MSDGVDGLLTPPGNSPRWLMPWFACWPTPPKYMRIGQAGRHTVEQRYQIGAHVAAIQSFYEQVLSNKG